MLEVGSTIRGNVSSGYGVFKSVDAGKTWTFSGLPNSRHIPRIVIDPNNNDIVYAAVLGNLYKPTRIEVFTNLLMEEPLGKKYFMLMIYQVHLKSCLTQIIQECFMHQLGEYREHLRV